MTPGLNLSLRHGSTRMDTVAIFLFGALGEEIR